MASLIQPEFGIWNHQ